MRLSPDPLGRHLQGSLSVDLPVMGIPVSFQTNSPRVMDLVEAAYGSWRNLRGKPDLIAHTSVCVRVLVDDARSGVGDWSLISRLPDSNRLLLSHPHAVAIADAERGNAVAYVSPDLLENEAYFHEAILEAMTLFLVTRLDRHPLHAAGVGHGDVAVVLAGPSGVGKSTLAYAMLRAGASVLSDDAVYVQLDVPRVWGASRKLHLPLDARRYFPELSTAPVRRAAGDEKIPVPLRDAPSVDAPVAEQTGLCLLRRGGGRPGVAPVAPSAIADALIEALDPGFDRFASSVAAGVECVASGGCWMLTLPQTPAAAIPWIQEMIAAVKRR